MLLDQPLIESIFLSYRILLSILLKFNLYILGRNVMET